MWVNKVTGEPVILVSQDEASVCTFYGADGETQRMASALFYGAYREPTEAESAEYYAARVTPPEAGPAPDLADLKAALAAADDALKVAIGERDAARADAEARAKERDDARAGAVARTEERDAAEKRAAELTAECAELRKRAARAAARRPPQ